MTRRLVLTVPLFVALLSNVALSAQQAPEKPAAPVKKDERVVVEKPAKGAAKPQRIEEVVVKAPSGPNVRVEVTLTDQQSGAPTTSKTVMLTTSNRAWGRLRSQINSLLYGAAPLNIDARPVVTDNRIALEMTIEYSVGRNADAEGNADKIRGIAINESLTVVLDSGKSLVVTQSADPISDRKVTVEVKATIVN